MVTYEDECLGCAVPAYPCLGSSCPNRNVKHLYCDLCKKDVETLYEVEGEELCADCALNSFEKIELED